MSDSFKVAVDLRRQKGATFPFSFEYMWAIRDGEREAIIDNIPFFAHGLNFKDRVEVRRQSTEKAEWVVSRVLARSGHSTIHVILTEGQQSLGWLQRAMALLLRRLKAHGCSYERSGDVLYAIDVPPDTPIKSSLLGMLAEASSEGKWEYEESGTEPFPSIASE